MVCFSVLSLCLCPFSSFVINCSIKVFSLFFQTRLATRVNMTAVNVKPNLTTNSSPWKGRPRQENSENACPWIVKLLMPNYIGREIWQIGKDWMLRQRTLVFWVVVIDAIPNGKMKNNVLGWVVFFIYHIIWRLKSKIRTFSCFKALFVEMSYCLPLFSFSTKALKDFKIKNQEF